MISCVRCDVLHHIGGPLDCPQWCTIRAARASEGGSNGVVFVLTAAGAYVVKASARPAEVGAAIAAVLKVLALWWPSYDCALPCLLSLALFCYCHQEYLGTLVLQQLGVPVPAVRVVCHVDAEWMAIKEAIKLASDKQAAVGDEESARKLRQAGCYERHMVYNFLYVANGQSDFRNFSTTCPLLISQ
eukprot:208727-Amphidinium_carterae.1